MPRKSIYTKLGNFFIILGISLLTIAYAPIVYDEVWYWYKTQKHQQLALNNTEGIPDSPFARLLTNQPINIQPANTDFAIVIEKLGVNAPIVPDVTVTDEDKYNAALKNGVAHAASSQYPSEQPGNVYLFAHSAIDFWNLGKYAKVFNLLRKLELGDMVHVFYDDKDFVYEVVNMETYKGWNTYPLTRSTLEPVLTLQTCDPPGTTLNRLVVTAVLKEVR